MLGKGLRLYKREKLCSVTAIDRLFAVRGNRGLTVEDKWGKISSALVYPLRMVYGSNDGRQGPPVKFLISVPKKKLRHATDRVTMRRRIREAYRHVRGDIADVSAESPKIDVAFIYVADRLTDYRMVEKAMWRLLPMLKSFTETPVDK
ncbi:MAG: ribonuclease P protein component [Muribaculaceae bacterium]|nr:ribonuclease P protein component [Muribaculaceae bacterium]